MINMLSVTIIRKTNLYPGQRQTAVWIKTGTEWWVSKLDALCARFFWRDSYGRMVLWVLGYRRSDCTYIYTTDTVVKRNVGDRRNASWPSVIRWGWTPKVGNIQLSSRNHLQNFITWLARESLEWMPSRDKFVYLIDTERRQSDMILV